MIEAVAGHYRRGISNMDGAFAASEEQETVAAARRAAGDLRRRGPQADRVRGELDLVAVPPVRSFAPTIGPGDRVVVTRLDHDANVRPWCCMPASAGADVTWVDVRPDDATIDLDSFDAALGEHPRLVAFTLASNAVGTVTPAASS